MAVQINVAANQAALTASIQAGVQAYNQRFAQNNQLNLTINPRAFSQPLGRITGDVKDFEAALAASNARVIAFGASTAVLGGVIRSFKELANVTIEVEKNLADINRVFGLTTSQLQKFSTDLFNVTKQTASSFNDASQAALEFSRQGLKAEETLQRTKDALTLTRLAGISTANAVDALTSTVNGFSATGVTTTQILNKLVAVEQDFAVGAGDLAEALSRTGQAAQEAGVSLDQLNALVTSAQQSTARGGAVIGNALKTIFTRLQRTDTLDQLEAFNIAVRDVQGNILPAVTILQNFAGAYRGLADAQRAQLSEQVAGVYQVNILKAIVNDLNKSQGVYAGALQRGAMATNEAEVATAKLNQTLDALLKQTATSTQQLANNIGKVTFEPLARYGTEQLKSLVESMNEILEGEGIGSTFANGLLKGIRNILAGPGAIAAFFTLFKLIQNSFTYLSQALPQIAGITTETQNRKNIEQAILQIMAQQGPVAQALAGTMGNQAAQAQLLLQVARQQTAEYQTQTALARQLAGQLAGQGVRVRGAGGLQVTRAGGYIPASTKMAEVVGAQAGGYAPGRVVSSPVGGVMNTAEDVKYVPGFAQPFINPPAGSKAGRAHRQNSISRTGVDPYMYRGFIPNFVSTSLDAIKLNENKVVRERTDFFDNFTANINPIELEKNINQYRQQAENIIGSSAAVKRGTTINGGIYTPKGQRNSSQRMSSINRDNLAQFIKTYRNQVSRSTLKRTVTSLKRLDGNFEYSLNQVQGLLGEADAKNLLKNSKVTQKNAFFDLIKDDGSLAEVRTRSRISKKDILVKAILERLTTKRYDNKTDEKIDLGSYDVVIPKGSPLNSQGFIPNFATPMTTASIPWFKKYSSKYKNAAGDADLFKMGDFPTYGRGLDHEYAKKGNSAMLSYLHEDFVRSALNIALGSKKVIRPAEVGFKDKPVSDISNENDFDLLYRIADGSYSMLELKQDFKNISGSVTGFMNKKLANLEKENPRLAKKVSSMIAVSNRPKFTDPTGRNVGANFSEFEMAAASIVKDKYSNVDPSISAKLTKVTDGLLRRYEAKKNTTYDGFIPNFAGKDIVTKFFRTQTGPDLFSSKGTGLSGTVYRQPGYRSSGYQLKEQLNNMVMSILGNNVFFPDASSLNPKIYGDVNKGAENSAKTAALKLSSGGKTSSLGLGAGMMSEAFGNSRYVPDREAVFTGQVSGKMKRVNYDRLSDILGAFWSANPETKSAWESLKNISETGKFEEKQNIRVKTSLLKKAYEDFLVKNNYIGTRVKLNSYRKRAEGVEGVNYGALRSDLAGVSNVRNIDKYGGFIPNFAYKQAVMGLEESMSGNKAVFDTKPFPHIRNSGQPTFSSAIADHGGLGNALSDSMRGQKAAGLMNDGFIPNFANSRSARRRIQRNQQSQQTNNTGGTTSFNPQQITAQAEKLAQDALRKINNAYQYIAVFGADFADIIENASKSATAKLKTSSANVKTSVGNLSNTLKLSFGNMFGKGQSSGGSKPPVISSGPNLGMFSKIGGGLSKAFANPVLAMIMPQIAGAVGSQFAYGDKKRYELTESERKKQSFANTGVTSISTGAFIGNMILPGWGAAIGAAVGGLLAFSQATKAAKLSIGEMQEKISETNTKQTNAITDYKNNLEQLALAIESGDEISKSKYTRDLATSFSGISSQNLNSVTEGKSVKQLEILISDINKKAATQTAILSASEKLTKGGKEVSFFDKFKQQAGEAILDFGNMTVDAFTTLGAAIVDGFTHIVKTTSTIFTTIVDRIKDPFFNFIDSLKSSFTSLSDYLGSSLRMIMLGFKQYVLNIQDFFGFGDTEKQNQLDSDILAANTVYEEASQKLQNSIMNGLQKGIDLGLKGLDIGKFVAKSFASLSLAGMAVNMAIESGPRKIQNYKMSDVASEYLKLSGGADISGFFKKIFKPDDELFGLIQTVGKSGATKDRESALNQIRSALIDRGVEGNDIDTLITSIRQLGETGNFKGQFVLNDFKKFLDELDASQEASKKAAAKMAGTFGDFVSLKQKIERDINDYLNQSRLAEVGITGEIQRRKISLEEQSRMSEFFGKPFQSAQYRNDSARLDIDREFKQAERDQINQSMAIIVDLNKKLNNTSISSLESLKQSLISENLTLDERLGKIKEFVQKSDTSFINPLDRQNFTEQVKSAKTTYDLSKEKNKEDIKTADYVYNLEIKRLQEARNFKLQLQSGLSSLSDEGNLMIGKLGRDLPGMFADGMVNGIKAAIKESDNLGDALMNVAANFLDSISTTLMQAGTRQILGSFGFENLFKAQKGGLIRAQSGMYISGTGSGDKYPAMLENGEYVLNRRAVMAMGGPAALDTLNFSMAPRFASGGSFNAELDDIKAMEDGMTTFGLENSSYYKELRDAEIQRAEQARQKKRARQAQTAQMVGSLVASVATMAIGAGLSNVASNMQAKQAQSLSAKVTASGGAGMTNSELGKLAKFQKSGLLGSNFEYKGPTNIQSGFKSFFSGPSLPSTRPLVTKPVGRQTGGLIGSRLSDTIPGYMEGGLYNSPIVKQYGAGMQGGGMSSVANNSNTVNNTNANNSFNFNTSVNRDGTIQMGADSSTYKQQDVELSNNLNTKIYGAVLDVIREQQRFGGSLAGTRKA